jgi:hypothetical protein
MKIRIMQISPIASQFVSPPPDYLHLLHDSHTLSIYDLHLTVKYYVSYPPRKAIKFIVF